MRRGATGRARQTRKTDSTATVGRAVFTTVPLLRELTRDSIDRATFVGDAPTRESQPG
jgi:hypothetical protein